jgi:hypothetical protein
MRPWISDDRDRGAPYRSTTKLIILKTSAKLDDFADHLLAGRALKDTLIVAWFIGLDARLTTFSHHTADKLAAKAQSTPDQTGEL